MDRILNFILYFLIAHVLVAFSTTQAEANVKTLVIRPDRIGERTMALKNMQEAKIRDLFNWSPEQLKKMAPVKPKQELKMDVFPEMDLSGLFWTKEHPMAVVNGQLVQEGEVINNVTIVEIHPESIVLEYGDEFRTIRIEPLDFELGIEGGSE